MKKLKILHTADWHIGNYRGPVSDGMNLRHQDILNCLEFLVEKAESEFPDVVLISGDIFNSAVLNEKNAIPEVGEACRIIRRLSMTCPVVAMLGTPNHDNPERFDLLKDVFRDNPDVYVVDSPMVLRLDGMDIALVPGFDKNYYRAKFPGLSKEEENGVFTEELGKIVLGLRAQCSPEGNGQVMNILMSHYTVPGCDMESGQVAFYNRSEPVLLNETLEAAGFDLVALGHIHKPQKLSTADNVYYSGAINTLNFNDEGQKRGFWIHEFDPGTRELESRFVVTPYREMRTIALNGDDIAGILDGTWPELPDVREKIVRVRYECTGEQQKAFQTDTLRKLLYEKGAFFVWDIEYLKGADTTARKELERMENPAENLAVWLDGKDMALDLKKRAREAAGPIIDGVMAGAVQGELHGIFEPVEIRVENYRNYREESFDFRDVSFCAINGKNGAGKSSLFFDAIMDCLYEETREGDIHSWISNSPDVRKGTISFTFSVGGRQFRVTRTRTKPNAEGKGSRTTLNLSEYRDREWVNRSRENLRDTQNEIIRTVGMDSLTFRSCALIMQDQYDIFMKASKTERMDIMSNLLGLGIYDRMLKETMRLLASERATRGILETEYDSLTASREALGYRKEDTEVLRLKTAEAEEVLRKQKDSLEECRQEIRKLEDMESGAGQLRERLKETETEGGALRDSIVSMNEHIAVLQSFLARAEETRKKAEEARKAERELLLLGDRKREAEELAGKERELLSRLDEEEKKDQDIRQKRRDLESRITALEEADLDTAREAAEEARKAEQKLADLTGRKEAFREAVTRLEQAEMKKNQELSAKEQEISRLESRLEELGGKKTMLENSGCPVPERASCRFLKDAMEAVRNIPETEAELSRKKDVLDCLSQEWNRELERMTAERDAIQYSQEEEHQLKKACEASRPDLERYRDLLRQRENLKPLRDTEAMLKTEQEALEERVSGYDRELSRIRMKLQETEGLEQRVAGLEKVLEAGRQAMEDEKQIPVMEERLKTETVNLQNLQEKRDRLQKEQEDIRQRLTGMERGIASLSGVRELETVLNHNTAIRQEELNRLHREAGRLDALREEYDRTGERLKEVQERITETAERETVYTVLKTAFGKEGIPHSIVRSVIPVLTSTANGILGQMTGGNMGIDFVTEKLKGDREAMTLDILIHESGKGTLPYMSKSGGEKVKASLASVLALSEIKQKNIGVQSGMLFIDEPPFLDPDGIEAYCDALETIQRRYGGDIRIMAITHDEGMKGRFPESVDVVKTDGGSRIIRQ